MAYSNNDRRNRSTSNGGGFNNRRANYSENRQANSQDTKKHSGCSMRDSYTRGDGTRIEAPVVWGWNKSQSRGFLKFVAVPCVKHKTKNPRWLRFLVTVTPDDGTKKFTLIGLWDIDKQRLHMKDLDMIANPGKNYWGRNYKPSNNNG